MQQNESFANGDHSVSEKRALGMKRTLGMFRLL